MFGKKVEKSLMLMEVRMEVINVKKLNKKFDVPVKPAKKNIIHWNKKHIL